MIGLITGQVQYLVAPTACIMTTSGVGYDVELPLPSFCQLQLNQQASIWTHFHVREDAQLLFGFIDRKERDVFRQLIKINGVGAKMALAMLSAMSAAELKMHVEQDSETALMRIPGIGKKTAQRLLIELKDKLKNIEVDDSSVEFSSQSVIVSHEGSIIAEVEGALISLGYKEKEAQQAIKAAKSNGDIFKDTQGLLKATLQQLSGF
ncbi:Holliday junction branch migration protein RuvA [Psychrobacter urativorans]|uniref:Holliday junction branch migration protein RuvA n=1 Tax=Psychrobacter urativorans TaxID=45610 RepID=UPI0019190CD9|nr:Holliday junction branch migration protein RuvA [Psychrobacter urativorans]